MHSYLQTHVTPHLFGFLILTLREIDYHMCPISDLGPLQHLRWNSLWQNSMTGSQG